MPELSLIEWIGVLSLMVYGGITVNLIYGHGQIPVLNAQHNNLSKTAQPSIHIIVAARNEAHTIAPALESLLGNNYPDLKVTVVNDRSTDNTASVVADHMLNSGQLELITIQDLPPQWMGKQHALWQGAAKADSEWLLFTDADVHFTHNTLTKAMAYAINHQLDHLTVMPELKHSGFILQAFTTAFSLFFSLYHQPWLAKQPGTKQSMGVGAFNLVKKSVYKTIGTHKALAYRPDDDMALGRLIKQAGFKQDVLWGNGAVSVQWYPSAWQLCTGLIKNAFALMGYSCWRVLWGVIGLLVGGLLPACLIFYAWIIHPSVLLGSIMSLLVSLLICLYQNHSARLGTSLWGIILFPVTLVAFSLILLSAMGFTLMRGGIVWRETFYPLPRLRATK